MNHIYKVIWSKAKHCYVVTSEIAKSHSKSAGSAARKAAAVLAAAMLLGSGIAVSAEDVTVNKDVTVPNTSYLTGKYLKGFEEGTRYETWEGDTVTITGKAATGGVLNNTDTSGLSHFAAWQDGNSLLNIDAGTLYVGSKDYGDDRGFQFKGENNTLNVHADKVVAYVGDGLINAQGSDGSSVANFGTADDRIGEFEAHTTYGKQDWGVALLQTNEGNTVNLYADKATLDGSRSDDGGVIGSGSYGTVNVDAGELTIDGNISGSYGAVNTDGKTLDINIKADKLTMDGDVNVGSLGTKSTSNFYRKTDVSIDAKTGTITGNVNVYGNHSTKFASDQTSNEANASNVSLNFSESGTINGKINIDGQTENREAAVTVTGNTNVTGGVTVKGTQSSFNVGDGKTATKVTIDGDVSVGAGAAMNVEKKAEVSAHDVEILGTLKTAVESLFTADTVKVGEHTVLDLNGDSSITAIDNKSGKSLLSLLSDNKSSHVLINGNKAVKLSSDEEGNLVFQTGSQNDAGTELKTRRTASLDTQGNFKAEGTLTGTDLIINGQSFNNAGIVAGTSAGSNGTALGSSAKAGNSSIAIGAHASAADGQNLALGHYASAQGKNNIALGAGSQVYGRDILDSDKYGVLSVGKSVGQSGEAGFTRRIINVSDGVNDTDAVNYGQLKETNNTVQEHTEVLEAYKKAGIETGTIGADVSNSIALGEGSVVHRSAKKSMALGVNASVDDGVDRSIALGYGSQATEDKTVSVGNDTLKRRITNVEDGIDQTDVVNVRQLNTVSGAVDAVNEKVGSGDFSRTAYAKVAANVTQAIYDVDAQVKVNADDLAAYKAAGVIAGEAVEKDSQSMALGQNAVVAGDYSVALGADSVADRANTVSVGSEENQRQITNVAAGTEETDAVNVSQLKTTVGEATKGVVYWDDKDESKHTIQGVKLEDGSITAADGKFSVGKDGTILANVGGSQLNINAESAGFSNGNASVAVSNGEAVISAGGSTIITTADGSAFTNANGATTINGSSITTGTIHAGGITINNDGRITGVAEGVDTTDAVNKGQLDEVQGAVDALDKIAVKYSSEDKSSVRFEGKEGTVLQNVAAGTEDMDAVNVKQLTDAKAEVNARIDDDRAYMGYGTELDNGQKTLANGINANTQLIRELDGTVGELDKNTVKYDDDSHTSITFTNGTALSGVTSVSNKSNVLDLANGSLNLGSFKTDGNRTSAQYGSSQITVDESGTTIGAESQILSVNSMGINAYGAMNLNGTLNYNGWTDILGGVNDLKTVTRLDGTVENVSSLPDYMKKNREDILNLNGQLSDLSGSLGTLGSSAVKYDDAGHSSVTFDGESGTSLNNVTSVNGQGGSKLELGENGATLSNGGNSLTVNDKGTSVSGDLTVNGNTTMNGGLTVNGGNGNSLVVDETGTHVTGDLTVNGNTVATEDYVNNKVNESTANLQGQITENKENIDQLKGDVGNVDNLQVTDKDGNKIDNLTDAVNQNAANIGDVSKYKDSGIQLDGKDVTNVVDATLANKEMIGSGKLDNGASDLTEGINQNTAAIQQNSNAIGELGRSVNKLGGEIDSVGAISAALAGLHPLDYDPTNSKYQLSAALGSYDGSSAVAFGGFYNINKDILLSAGVSTVLKGERKTAGNLGVTFRVGSGSSGEAAAAANLKEANQQLAALRQDNKVLATKNDKLTEALSAQGEKLNAQGEEMAALKAQVEALLKGTQPAKTAEVKEAKAEAKAETKAEVNTEAKAEAADVKADTQAAETDKK